MILRSGAVVAEIGRMTCIAERSVVRELCRRIKAVTGLSREANGGSELEGGRTMHLFESSAALMALFWRDGRNTTQQQRAKDCSLEPAVQVRFRSPVELGALQACAVAEQSCGIAQSSSLECSCGESTEAQVSKSPHSSDRAKARTSNKKACD